MLKISAGTIIVNLLMIIFISVTFAGGFEEDPGPEELPVEQAESVIVEPEEPTIEPEEPTIEPEVTVDAGIVDASGNIVTWSQGNVSYAGDVGNIYVKYGL